MRTGRIAIAIAAFCAASIAVVGTAAAANDTQLISRLSGSDGAPADRDAGAANITANGRYVSFVTDAANFGSPAETFEMVFVRDRQSDKTTLASILPASSNAFAFASGGAMSDDGRYVVFHGSDYPAEPQDGVFVRDMVKKRTRTITSGEGQCCPDAIPSSYGLEPDISADGETVVWYANQHIWTRQRTGDSEGITQVDRTSGGKSANCCAGSASVSEDGRYVAFVSGATNMPGANGHDQVYVRDLEKDKTILVSRRNGSNGKVSDGPSPGSAHFSGSPSISANGRVVAFESYATNLSTAAVTSDPAGPLPNVYVRDLDSNQTHLVSRADGTNGAGGDAGGSDPAISANGNSVAFGSRSLNLRASFDKPEDGAAGDQVYVRNLSQHVTVGVSRDDGAEGSLSSGGAFFPALSQTGNVVAFQSNSTTLGGDAGPFPGAVPLEVFARVRK